MAYFGDDHDVAAKIFCGPCDFKHITVDPVAWCPECNEGMCSKCIEQHTAFAATRQHETIDMDNYRKLPRYLTCINLNCDDHDDKLNFYCRSHDERCCHTCIPSKHKECLNVTTLETVVKNVKSSTALVDMLQDWKDLFINITKMINMKKNNLKEIDKQKSDIEIKIKSIRRDINALLDNLEERALQELGVMYSDVTEAEKRVISEMELQSNRIRNYQQLCDDMKSFASDLQTFLGIKHYSSILTDEKRGIMSHLKNGCLKNMKLGLKTKATMTMKARIKSLCKIVVGEYTTTFKFTQSKSDQAQFMPIQNTHLNDIRKIKLEENDCYSLPPGKIAVNIRDCAILSDGRYVLTDFSATKRLMIFKSLNMHTRDVTLPWSPSGIASIDGSTIAVLLGDENEIVIIELSELGHTVTQKIKLQNRGWSLSHSDGKIAVTVKCQGILLMDIKGDIIRSIPVKCDYSVAVHLDQNTLYYADSMSHIVYSSTLEGVVNWKCQLPEGRDQYSLTTDDNGYVYVACYHSNNIKIISKDGRENVSLVNSGLHSPTALEFDMVRKQLFCATADGKLYNYGISHY